MRQQKTRSKATFKALILALIVHVAALLVAIGVGWFPDTKPAGETVIQARVVQDLPPTKEEPTQKKQVQKKEAQKDSKKTQKDPKKAIPLKKNKKKDKKKTEKKDSKKLSKAEQEDLQRRLKEDEKDRAAAALQGKVNKAKNEFVPLIQQRVQSNWNKPDQWKTGVKCVVNVRMVPGGIVTAVTIIRSCGNPVYDRSVEVAVRRASPLPVPKDSQLFEAFRSINFTFNPKE